MNHKHQGLNPAILRFITGLLFILLAYNLNASHTDSLFMQLNTTDRQSKATIYLELSQQYQDSLMDSAFVFAKKAINLSRDLNNKLELDILMQLADLNYLSANYNEALAYYDTAKKRLNLLDLPLKEAEIAMNTGIINEIQGSYDLAFEKYLKALKIYELLVDSSGMAGAYNNLGILNKTFSKYELALEYFEKSLLIQQKIDNEQGIASILNNIGIIYDLKNNPHLALEYYLKSLAMNRKLGNKLHEAYLLHNIGIIYEKQQNHGKAIRQFLSALEISKDIDDKQSICYLYHNLGKNYRKTNQFAKAKKYFGKSLDISKQLGVSEVIYETYAELSKLYKQENDFEKAYLYLDIYTQLKDSVMNVETQNRIAELQTQFETAQKEKQIEALEKEKAIKELEQQRDHNRIRFQSIIITITILAIILLSIFLFFLVRLYLAKQKANNLLRQKNNEISIQRDDLRALNKQLEKQKAEITRQKQKIENQRDTITVQNHALVDNIKYARRIQNAMITPFDSVSYLAGRHFIMNQPKGIVSGDFYWASQLKNKIIVAAVDCTGHGVTGAFMSVLGMSLLNQIVNVEKIIQPDIILNHLRKQVIEYLHQTGKEDSSEDGMDLSLISFDIKTGMLEFAGANNSIYLASNASFDQKNSAKQRITHKNGHELLELKPDKMPVSYHSLSDIPFTKQQLKIDMPSMVYLTSDGFIDQFGGENDSKFLKKHFKSLILKVHDYAIDQQKEIFQHTFKEWKGDFEQVDDVLVIGIKLGKVE